MFNSIDSLLNAQSIAVVGANEKSGYSGRLIKNLINNQYSGRVFPVNPKYEKVFGVDCFPSISSINNHIDLAIIIVHADFVVQIVEECEKKKVSSILIISAGFSEHDKVLGSEREEKLNEIAKRSGMRIVGPNCLGIANVVNNMWACSLSTLGTNTIKEGRAGLISHSGATGFGPLLTQARDKGVGFKYIVTTGNEADLNLCHFIKYMLEDEEIDVIAVLIEGLKDGKEFLRIAERAKELKKPIVVFKIGESEVGQRAAANHTASMTGDDDIFNAIVEQKALIRVNDYDELIDCVKVLQNKKRLLNKKMAVVSHSGGIGGTMGDKLGKFGFSVPVLSEAAQQSINQYLKGFGSPQNPLDLTGQLRSGNLKKIIEIVEKHEDIDGYVFATHGDEETVNRIIEIDQTLEKPLFVVWTGSIYDESLNILKNSSIPIFLLPEKASKILAAIINWGKNVQNTHMSNDIKIPSEIPIKINEFRESTLNEVQAKSIFSSFGIPVPHQVLLEANQDVKNLKLDFLHHKYVMKLVSNKITHKSEVGGVVLNIDSIDKFEESLGFLQKLKNSYPDIQDIMVEEMCEDGLELIVGINKDPQFGPVLMFGLGGITAELFKQVAWRVLPINRFDIKEMIYQIPGLVELIQGYRNQPSYDMEALIDTLERLSLLGQSAEIESVEINPLRLLPTGKGVVALDGIVTLRKLELTAN
ncbi:acetate--CoA ligase family protein [Bacillus sp. ISL-47]|uniref:acetate--CoA ligase family protein n=1 Tax=Bacillus sp. ISL-47 TaxID=2819130 RepID=UPI001BE92DB8|nr:acetate--CoA ligase family protein [Bacillus sp. ISL-47]MBT2689247.1 acetate--CoA ligase family protein [Bacillus sp. ISL-47]MBT2708628.1 acetate--CoA ligase family protein [Pseudomonas sp. ISL-84]